MGSTTALSVSVDLLKMPVGAEARVRPGPLIRPPTATELVHPQPEKFRLPATGNCPSGCDTEAWVIVRVTVPAGMGGVGR